MHVYLLFQYKSISTEKFLCSCSYSVSPVIIYMPKSNDHCFHDVALITNNTCSFS